MTYEPCEIAQWLMENFPDESWAAMADDSLLIFWMDGVSCWARVVDEWERGDYSNHQPANANAFIPINGLNTILTWSNKQGRKKQVSCS
eukprot:SAG31_NODE_2359_length_5873_cov_2.496363_3_plen_89_part_00